MAVNMAPATLAIDGVEYAAASMQITQQQFEVTSMGDQERAFMVGPKQMSASVQISDPGAFLDKIGGTVRLTVGGREQGTWIVSRVSVGANVGGVMMAHLELHSTADPETPGDRLRRLVREARGKGLEE